LTWEVKLSQSVCVKITGKGQVTIPPAMRKKHGLLPRREVEFVDRPDGVLVVKASKLSRGRRVLATLLRGGKIRGDTESWLRLTRGAA
jgi:bifunctional DNA-binding transcriptional regulator/antitoxin component of YhaV-PrlF toxin-antitoxin module